MFALRPTAGTPPQMRERALKLPEPAGSKTTARKPADAAKSAFLRMVSHELRTPLNSIIGFSEILSQELYGPIGQPRYKDYAGIIRQSGHKLLALVNQIVEIVRLQDGAAELELQPEPLAFAVGDVAEALAERAGERHVRIKVEDGAMMPWVIADQRALRTVLTNLLENAIAFSPRGAEVRVSARRTGEQVEIVIEDHGEGLDPADVPRLMQPFEQGEGSLTRSTEGAGLGLPIVRLLCEAMDGRFELDGQPGKGAVATVVLPAARLGRDVADTPPAA
jgi:signal transduction histidine kinase